MRPPACPNVYATPSAHRPTTPSAYEYSAVNANSDSQSPEQQRRRWTDGQTIVTEPCSVLRCDTTERRKAPPWEFVSRCFSLFLPSLFPPPLSIPFPFLHFLPIYTLLLSVVVMSLPFREATAINRLDTVPEGSVPGTIILCLSGVG